MSTPYIIQDTTLEDIADAIRSKTDTTELIDPADMAEKINSIQVTDEDDVLRDLRGSFAANVGGGYSNKSLAELVGTAEGDDSLAGSNFAYNNGAIYGIRDVLGYLANAFSEETIENSLPKIDGAVETISDSLADIKSNIVATLNAILDPETEYDTDTPWFEIKELVENLPDDVGSQTASAVDSNSAGLRTAVDNAISAIIAEYELDVELVTGTWEATLNNLTAVCAALDAQASPPVIQPLTATANGTYTAPSGVDGYSPVTVNTDPEKGFVLGDYDSNGYPTTARFVGIWSGSLGQYFYSLLRGGSAMTKNINELVIPEGITAVGSEAFRDCLGLRAITFPTSFNTSLTVRCFFGTNLKKIVFKSPVKGFSYDAFRGCSFELFDASNHSGAIPSFTSLEYFKPAKGCIFRISLNSILEWKNATNWSGLSNVVWQFPIVSQSDLPTAAEDYVGTQAWVSDEEIYQCNLINGNYQWDLIEEA